MATLLPGVKAPATIDAYHYAMSKHVLPALGNKALEDIRTADLQRLVDDLHESGQLNPARQPRSATVTVFECAVPGEKLSRNPAKSLVVKSAKHVEEDDEESHVRRFLTQEEKATLLATAEGTDMYLPILLGARFGLRIGECIGPEMAEQ